MADPGQSASSRQIPALSGLRALAAIGVLATHTGYVSGRSLRPGSIAAVLGRLDFGVAVFFLLSGFLLFRPFARSFATGSTQPSILIYVRKRLVRIFPAAWVAIAVTLAVLTTARVRLADWWSYLLLVQTYTGHDYLPDLTQLWTLTTELAFYAVLPLVAMAIRGRGAWSADRSLTVLTTMIVAPIGYAALVFLGPLDRPSAILWLPAYLDWFALGMALALIVCASQDDRRLSRGRRVCVEAASTPVTCWVIAGLLFLLTTLPLGTPRDLSAPTFWQWGVQHYLFGASAFLILLPMVAGPPGRVDRVLGSRLGRYCGDLSYAFYLWHLPVLLAIHRWFGYPDFSGNFWLLFAATFAATAAISALSWRILERPLLRHLDASLTGGRAGGTTQVAAVRTPSSTRD